MSRIYCVLAVASLLTACGGGGSDRPATAAAAATSVAPPAATPTSTPTQPTVPVTAPASPPTQLASMPVSTSTVKLSASSFTLNNDAQVSDVTFTGAVNLTIKGQLNKLWIDAKAPGGAMTVDGTQNTVVFKPGVSTVVNVSGSANTFIMQANSPITLTGSGVAASTVQYYAATATASTDAPH